MKPLAILHEDNDHKTLIENVINHLKLDKDKVEFYRMGTKTNFFKPDYKEYKLIISRINADQIEKILFVIDADYANNDEKYGGYNATTRELDIIINNFKIQDKSKTYIVCDPNNKSGNYESLILSTITEERKFCIERFLDCSNFERKNNHKAIFNQVYKLAYPDDLGYDFQHKNFQHLKTTIQEFFK